MKINKTLSLTIVLFFSAINLFSQTADDSIFETTHFTSNIQQDSSEIYFVDLPSGLDTIAFRATITLTQDKSNHKIKFPNGGTETNVYIYDNTYLEKMQNNTLTKPEPLANGNFSYDQEVLLDITLLQRGQYYVHYLSCGLGGIFPLIIE
jgi:hypothetical protein